jgi:hydroxypyruvate reductase 1
VFEEEPAMKPGLADLPNIVIVPHIASASMWTRSGMVSETVRGKEACVGGGRLDQTQPLTSS